MQLRVSAWVRRLVLNVSLALIASLAGLVLCESLVRLVAPQQLILLRPDIWAPADSVGYRNRPNVITSVNTGDRTVALYTDSGGFRVGKTPRPLGRTRVLLIGDSFMAALQVEYEQSLAGLIEQCLISLTGETTAVWNAAVDGWDPPQYYFEAARLLREVPFDLVVVSVYLGNDVVNWRRALPPRKADSRRGARLPTRLTSDEFVDAVLRPINDFLETRSHLFTLMKNRAQAVRMRLGLTGIELPLEIQRREAESPRWRTTGTILAGIDSIARAHGVPAAFFLIPTIEQVEPSVMKRRTTAFGVDPAAIDVDQPDRLLGAELTRGRVSFVSLLGPFREAQRRGVSLYGRVDPHLSADGHRLVWNAVSSLIAQRLGSITPHADSAPSAPQCGAP